MSREFIKEKRKRPSLTERLSLEFMKLDLASLKSVMEFIEEFKASGRSLHALVCNAGIGPYRQSKYACNYMYSSTKQDMLT